MTGYESGDSDGVTVTGWATCQLVSFPERSQW
jgi:hypothetical protein